MDIITETTAEGKTLVLAKMQGVASYLELPDFEKKLNCLQPAKGLVVLVDFSGVAYFSRYGVEGYLKTLKRLSSRINPLIFLGMNPELKEKLIQGWMKDKVIWEKNLKTAFKRIGIEPSKSFLSRSGCSSTNILSRLLKTVRGAIHF